MAHSTSAGASPDSGTKVISITPFLWAIPLLTWILLIAIYAGHAHPRMVNVLSTDDTAVLEKARRCLDSHQVLYELAGTGSICVEEEIRDKVASLLTNEGLHVPDFGLRVERWEESGFNANRP